MMKNCYVLESSTRTLLEESHLLIDTNVVIDAANFPDEFFALFEELLKLKCIPCNTHLMRLEYLGGTKNEEDLKQKIRFLDQIAATIPTHWETFNKETRFNKLLLAFSRQAQKFAFMDFSLALTLDKYKDSGLLLMTRNHLDFTHKLFDRKGYITLFGNKDIKTYGIYSIKEY